MCWQLQVQPPGTRKHRQICGLIYPQAEADFEPTCKKLCTLSAHSKRWFPWRLQRRKRGFGPWWQLGLTVWMEDIIPIRHNNPHHPQNMCPCMVSLCLIRFFFLSLLNRWESKQNVCSEVSCFTVSTKSKALTSPWTQHRASSFHILTCPVLTPAGAAERDPQQFRDQCPNVTREAELMGKVNPQACTEERDTCVLRGTAYLKVVTHKNSQGHYDRNLDSTCTQLTWLMCLSLSMIWLMTGSGGLLLRDSEPGCDRFRPGPANLTAQEGNMKSVLIFKTVQRIFTI